MILEAIRSIKSDPKRSFFYYLTFVLTSLFIFLFFNISLSSQVGVKIFHANNDVVTFVTVFVIAICMIVIFFANDFFVKKKAKELAVRLVCGGTYTQITAFLLGQTFILLLLAIPVGVGTALSLIPVFNTYTSYILGTNVHVAISNEAIVATVIILMFVVLWATILNLGYTYRNSIATLLKEQRPLPKNNMMPELFNFTIPKKVKDGFFLFLFIIPIPVFYYNGSDRYTLLAFSFIGMIGFSETLKRLFIPYLDYLSTISRVDHPKTLAILGFVRYDLNHLKRNIILFLVSSIFLVSVMVTKNTTALEKLLMLLSYAVMNILLMLAVMFQYSTIITERKHHFNTLRQIGYSIKDTKKIVFFEVLIIYLLIAAIALFYIGNAIVALVLQGAMNMNLIPLLFLFLFLLVPLLLCFLLTYVYYLQLLRNICI